MPYSGAHEQLREEFNRWAHDGRGAGMARHHDGLADRVFERLGTRAGDRILDVGCGTGWACRRLAPVVGEDGLVVGLDLSDAMLLEAGQETAALAEPPRNVRYLQGSAESIPWTNAFFGRAFSIENFYYCPDQRAALEELHRVVAPGGRLVMALCLFAGSPHADIWPRELGVAVQVKSPAEYVELLASTGWREPRADVLAPASSGPASPEPDPHAHALLLTAVRGG